MPISAALMAQAHRAAQSASLGTVDALHIASAKISGTEGLATTERLTTALFRVVGLTITTI
jgi:hypothetical protein